MCFEVFAKSFSRQGRRRTIQQPPPLSEHDDDASEDDDDAGEHNDDASEDDDKGLFLNDFIIFGGFHFRPPMYGEHNCILSMHGWSGVKTVDTRGKR